MCNLSQGVLDKGIVIGEVNGEVKSLRKMMKNFHVSFTEAADALEIPEADRPKYKKLVEDSDSSK
ncbi:MAG: hypothetical protein ACI4T6_03250 [Candidatus Flemingiibacterium sp.]